MNNFQKLITKFLLDLENNKQRTVGTVRNYDLYLQRFSFWLEKNNIDKVEKINLEIIKKYSTYLKKIKIKKNNLNDKTQNYHLIAVRAFLKYLARKNIKTVSASKVKLNKTESKKPRCLSEKELARFLETPIIIKQDKLIALRDKAILELLFCTGCKVSQVAELTKKQINFRTAELSLIFRNDKTKVIKLTNQAKYWLAEYYKKRKDKTEFVFIGYDRANKQRQSNPLTARSIERIVEKYGMISQTKNKVTPQVLRHTYAYYLIKKGVNLENFKSNLDFDSSTNVKEYYNNL